MTRARCVLAAFVIAFAVLQAGAPAAQQYDGRPDILRAKIREMGAGFVGYVKSATADTLTVISDGSYSVIAKGEEYTFQITPNTTVSQMKEDGKFKPPQALQANELRAAEFVGVVEDTQNFRSDRHIALQIYTLPASTAGRPPAGLAAAPAAPPPAPPDLSPPMQQRYREGYADWRKREQIHGSQFVGSVQSATPDTVTVISDRDSSIWLRKGSQYTFHFTPETKVESDDLSHGKELRGGQQVTIRYRDMGDTHLALGIHIWPAISAVEAPSSLAKQGLYGMGQVKLEEDPDFLAAAKLHHAGEYRQAVDLYDSLISKFPQDPFVYFNRGDAYMNLNQFERAAQDFSDAIPRFQNEYDESGSLALFLGLTYQERAEDYVHMNRNDRALEDYAKAGEWLAKSGLDLSQTRASIYAGSCSALHNLTQDQLALDNCNKAVSGKPNDAWNYVMRGVVLFRLGKPGLARGDFARAVELDPSRWSGAPMAGIESSLNADALFHLDPPPHFSTFLDPRATQEGAGNATSPIDAPSSPARQGPGRVKPEDDPDALAGGKQMDAKQYRDAIASFDRSTANLPQMPYAYFNRGECYMHLEQYDRATQDFTAAIARYSNLGEQPSNLALELGVAYQERGHASVHLHQDDRAVADYNQALRYLAGADQGPLRDGYYQAIYEGRCSALHNVRQDNLALDDCNKALARKPKDAYRYLTRGAVLFRLGKEDLARIDFARATELDSSLRPGLASLENSLKTGKLMHLDP